MLSWSSKLQESWNISLDKVGPSCSSASGATRRANLTLPGATINQLEVICSSLSHFVTFLCDT